MKQDNVILLPKKQVTAKYILEVKEKYHLSWSDMDLRMRYAPRSKMSYHAYRHPEKFLSERFAKRFIGMVSQIEKEKGHTFEIVSFIKHIPKMFRIAAPPVKCLGHNELTFNLPKNGFCSEECKELYRVKKTKRKGG